MQDIRVTMYRPTLDGLPQFPLPAGFALRWYQPGDRATWVRVQQAAEKLLPISDQLFDDQFSRNEAELARRQVFLCAPDGAAIGTATAWFHASYRGRPSGRIHWVAIVPAWQGRGLSRPLLTAVGNRLRDLGHDQAFLVTSSTRLPALSLYLEFGFQPEITEPSEQRVWGEIRRALAEAQQKRASSA